MGILYYYFSSDNEEEKIKSLQIKNIYLKTKNNQLNTENIRLNVKNNQLNTTILKYNITPISADDNHYGHRLYNEVFKK